MSAPMSKRKLWMLRGIVTLASVGVVTLLAWLFLPPSYGAFVSVSHLDYFKDMSDPKVLVGSSQDVFILKVTIVAISYLNLPLRATRLPSGYHFLTR